MYYYIEKKRTTVSKKKANSPVEKLNKEYEKAILYE